MARRNQARRVGQIPYQENSSQSIDIPRDYDIRQILIEAVGSLVIGTAGSPVLYTGGCGSALRCITRLELVANGRETIKSLSASALAMKNLILHGTVPQLTETGITAATHPYGGVLVMDLANPRSTRPIDTLLAARKLSTLTLRATFGNGESMFSTNPTTITSNDCDLEISIDESINRKKKPEIYSAYKENYLEDIIAAATTNLQLPIPTGNRFRGMLIECESDGNMVDTILNSIIVRSGTDVFFSRTATEIRGKNAVQFNLQAQTLTGYYYIDFCEDGLMVDALDATYLGRLEVSADVNAPGTTDVIRIYPCELVSPQLNAAALAAAAAAIAA